MKNLIYKPPPRTMPTLIHDAHGMGILCYFPKGNTQGPRNLEVGIHSAQLGITVEQCREQMKQAEGK